MDNFGNNLSSGGQVLSHKELKIKRQRTGLCPTCGRRCFKKKLFKLEPLTVPGKILDGRCLLCKPQDPKKEELVASCAATPAPASKPRQRKKKGARGDRGERELAKSAFIPAPTKEHLETRRQSLRSLPEEGDAPKEKKKINRRASLTKRDSFRNGDFMERQTPRPSIKFLEGIDIDDLFKDDIDDDRPDLDIKKNRSAVSRLSTDERHALQSLNSDDNSFLEIVTIMMMNSLSEPVQNEGLHALSLVHEPDVRLLKECASICGFEIIIGAMGICSKDAMAQTNACKVLFIAGASGEDLQGRICEAGGFEALVDAMKEFENDMIVIEGCLLALSTLCTIEENLPSGFAKVVIERAINAMSEAVENCGLQEHGCSVLANLAVHTKPRKQIRDYGGCDTVVVSMVVNPLDVGVQCQAMVALRNLCVMDDENKVLLANAGAIDVVIQAMLNHSDDVQIQYRGSWVLGIIGIDEDNKQYIGENGGLDVIIRSMIVHAKDLEVQEKGCRALWTLSVNDHNRYAMVETEAIPTIVAAMQNHAADPEIQERGCGVLCNLVTLDDNLKVEVVDVGALDVIVMAMVLHGENERIQERAVTLLFKLCIPENISRMVNANVSPMMAVAEAFPNCREKASFVLSQLQTS